MSRMLPPELHAPEPLPPKSFPSNKTLSSPET